MGLLNEIAATTILRIILGLLFFYQGYDKVIRVGIAGVIEAFEYPMKEKKVPRFLVVLAGYYTSIVEFVFGFLLIIGFLTKTSMYFLGSDLVIVTIALGMLKPMWDMEHVFPRLAILITLLLLPSAWNVLSVDEIIKYLR